MSDAQKQQLIALEQHLPELERRVFQVDAAIVDDRDIVLYWLTKIALSAGKRLEALEANEGNAHD